MAFFIILLLLIFTIVAAPWLGADSRNLGRDPHHRPDWAAYPSHRDQPTPSRQNR